MSSLQHSGLARTSFWTALVGVFVPLVLVVSLALSAAASEDPFYASSWFFMVGRYSWVVFGMNLVALTLGIAALFGEGRKILAWAGASLSALPVFGFAVLMVSAETDSQAWTERWRSSLNMTVAPAEAIRYLTHWTGDGIVFHEDQTHHESRGELVVPVDRPVKLELESSEPIEFSIPAFRVQRAADPNRYSSIWFQATQPGDYKIFVRRDVPGADFEPAGTVRVVER